jgi:glycosyltransferase involved in cell wall biosynthesis
MSVLGTNPCKRILISATLYGAGGTETHLLNLSQLLVRHGAEVTVVVRYANPETPLVKFCERIPVRFLKTPFAGNLRLFRLSTAWSVAAWPFQLPQRHFDVLYTFQVSRFTGFLARHVKRGGQLLWSIAGEPLIKAPKGYANTSFLTGVIVETEMQAEAARSALNDNLPVGVIPLLGHVLKPPPRQPRLVHQIRITFLGRFHRQKGVYRLLDLWSELDIQPARLDFYGHGEEGTALNREIQRRGLSPQVRVNGPWSNPEELSAILSETDLMVLPSETEGLPVVLLEAMAHGVPFVATDVGAVKTLAQDNPDVRVVALESEALKGAIQELAHDIRGGCIRGDRLQQYHHAHYGYEALSERWLNALLNPERFW